MAENSVRYILTIEDQKSVCMSGVVSVASFSPQQILLDLGSVKMTIGGNNLKITEFSKETGKFTATGEISSVRYSTHAAKVKLFK